MKFERTQFRTRIQTTSQITIKNPAKYFLIVAFVAGMMFIILTPPFQGADEGVHFLTAARIADGHFIADKYSSGALGGRVDNGFTELVNKTLNDPNIAFHPDQKMHLKILKSAVKINVANKSDQFVELKTESYPPTTYLPYSMFIYLGLLVGIKPLFILYLARLGGLMCWLLATYVAIRIIPVRKYTFAIISLVPMLVFQASIVTADTMAFALVALAVAQIVKLRLGPTSPTKRQWCLLALTLLLMCISKQLMFFFVPLVFLVEGKRRNYKESRVIMSAIVLASLPVSFFWPFFVQHTVGVSNNYGIASPSKQFAFIISRPWALIRIFCNTFLTTAGDSIYRSFFGTFGWLDTPLPFLLVGLSAFVTFAAFRIKSSLNREELESATTWKLRPLEKAIAVLLIAAYAFVVSFAMYIYSTPLKYSQILGIQGRYYLPALFVLIFFFMGPDKLSDEATKRLQLAQSRLLIAATVILFFCGPILINRYYIA